MDIHHNFYIKGPIEKVFDAFTTPEGLNSWWTLQSAGKPVHGNEYTFYFGPEYDWRAVVIEVIPQKSLTWKMTTAMTDWMPTTFGFILSPGKDGTKVSFFHKGWLEANEHFGITTYCWGQLLAGLKRYIEAGTIIPFEDRN